MKVTIISISIALLTLLSTGCSSQRKPVSQHQGAYAPQGGITIHNAIGVLDATYSPWSDVEMPVRLQLSSPKSVSISGKAVMVRDKEIYLSFRMLGFEVASVYMNTDSVYAADKYHKVMFAESLTAVTGKLGVTIGNIQDMLTGRAFSIDSKKGETDWERHMTLKQNPSDPNSFILTPKRMPREFDYCFILDVTDGIPAVDMLSVTPNGREAICCKYSGLKSTPCGMIMQQGAFSAEINDTPVNATIKWDLGGAKWNTGKKAPWRQPKGYTRLDRQNIIEIFKSL